MLPNKSDAIQSNGFQDIPPLSSVFIVDDDPLLCAVLEAFFTKKGAGVVEIANNGAEAIAKVNQSNAPFDLIMCDLNMPEVDGVQFFRKLNKSGYTGPICILSSEDQATITLASKLSQAHQLHVVGALKKPLKFDELELVLNKRPSWKKQDPDITAEHITAADLRDALANGHITAYYQPKVAIHDDRITGVEALARWERPGLPTIPPIQFIDLAEQEGLMEDLTLTILKKTIADAEVWHKLKRPFKTAINISVSLLTNVDFPDEIAAHVDESGLPRSRFILEITENKLIDNETTVMEALARLKIMGFGLSIDDFGTGYSNVERLRDYPFDELKIDRSFVTSTRSDEKARTCAAHSVALAHDLGLSVVAEGVETKQDLDFVTNMNVEELQGYLITKPMPMDQIIDWVWQNKTPIANLPE